MQLGEDYLFGNGNIYVSALWDRTAAGNLKTGTIARSSDGIEILRDAASRIATAMPYSPRKLPSNLADNSNTSQSRMKPNKMEKAFNVSLWRIIDRAFLADKSHLILH